jgi:hypothetical protein
VHGNYGHRPGRSPAREAGQRHPRSAQAQNRGALSLDAVAAEIGIARTTLTARLKLVQADTIEKFARWTRYPAVSKAACELLVLLGFSDAYVAALTAPTGETRPGSNIIPFPPPDRRRRRRWKPPASDAFLPVFRHAALQLEARDFPSGALRELAFETPNPERVGLEYAAITDLLTTFVDARYFAAFASALRSGTALPQHPFDAYSLEPFLYPEKVAAFQKRVEGTPVRELYMFEQFVFEGRDPRAIFKTAGDESFASLEAFLADATATGFADTFPPFNNTAFDTVVSQLKAAAAAPGATELYDTLHDIVNFKPCDWPIPEKKLVLTAASCAAIRAELTAMCTAYTFRLAWGDDLALAGTPLVAISSKIFELCHETYLLTAEHWGQAIRRLPKTKQRQYVSDGDLMDMQYRSTITALASDDGLWFMFGEKKRGLAFLSRNGSVFQTDVLDEDGTSERHRFVTHDPALMPTRFERGKDDIFAF